MEPVNSVQGEKKTTLFALKIYLTFLTCISSHDEI